MTPEVSEKKARILNGCLGFPIKNVAKYIVEGEVKKSEVVERFMQKQRQDKIEALDNMLRQMDDQEWLKACEAATPESFKIYCDAFPDGAHVSECAGLIKEAEETVWQFVLDNMNEDTLRNYIDMFPDGSHISECRALISDIPWMQAKSANTIMAYEDYMMQYPGRHDFEANAAINDLNDDKDWNNACASGGTDAIRWYLSQHPNGNHAMDANNRIYSMAGKENFIANIQADKNYYTPFEIQEQVGNGVLSWYDLESIFTPEQVEAIKNYEQPQILPFGNAPAHLSPGNLEVYFWGTPKSGKTCAMGAILSAASKFGALEKRKCQEKGRFYMDQLCNIFVSNGVCTFPEGTPDDSFQEMVFSLRDKDQKAHKLAMIDLAGELFRAMYLSHNGGMNDVSLQQSLDSTERYLADKTNAKIHFFLVPYGDENDKWDNLSISNYLEECVSYLETNNIIKDSTKGIYILVTKSDKMDVPREERERGAKEYIEMHMPGFYNTLKNVCRRAGVKDLEVIPFSVGDVFAQKLCNFDPIDTRKVLNKLILKSPAEKKGFWKFLDS